MFSTCNHILKSKKQACDAYVHTEGRIIYDYCKRHTKYHQDECNAKITEAREIDAKMEAQRQADRLQFNAMVQQQIEQKRLTYRDVDRVANEHFQFMFKYSEKKHANIEDAVDDIIRHLIIIKASHTDNNRFTLFPCMCYGWNIDEIAVALMPRGFGCYKNDDYYIIQSCALSN